MQLAENTAKALVVDDNFEEIVPVIRALSDSGIGCAYFDGTPPSGGPGDNQLDGVRIAFMDMHMSDEVTDDAPARHAADYLCQLIGQHPPSTVGIFCFTKYTEEIEDFTSFIYNNLDRNKIMFVESIEKPHYDNNDEVVNLIKSKINELTENKVASRLLAFWEQVVHEATNDTLGSLTEIALGAGAQEPDEQNDKIENSLRTVLSVLASGAKERRATDGKASIDALFDALSAVQQDRMEYNQSKKLKEIKEAAEKFKNILDGVEKDIKEIRGAAQNAQFVKQAKHRASFRVNIVKGENDEEISLSNKDVKKVFEEIEEGILNEKTNRLPDDLIGNLNAFINLSFEAVDGEPMRPGTIFKAVNDSIISYNACNHKELFGTTSSDDSLDKLVPIIVEVSPFCDHAQGKVSLPRFVGGCLVPEEQAGGLLGRADYLWQQAGPLYFPERVFPEEGCGGVYRLVLNAHVQTARDNLSDVELKPMARVRRNTLLDIQAWLARHGSRPGVMTVS